MTFNRLVHLPGKVIQKMCQASLIVFTILGIVVFLRNYYQDGGGVRSLALGVALWLFPNCYFLIKIMGRFGQVLERDLLNIFYRAELIKLLFSGISFVVAIKFLSVNIPILLLAYFVSQFVFWLLLIVKMGKAQDEW